MTVWKFPLVINDYQHVGIPALATILTVQVQKGVPCLWVRLEETASVEPRQIITVGTGHPFPDYPLRYIGSYQLSAGALVFHVFERIQ